MKRGDLVTVHHHFKFPDLLLAKRREDGEFVSGKRRFHKGEIGLILRLESELFRIRAEEGRTGWVLVLLPGGTGWVQWGFLEVISEEG